MKAIRRALYAKLTGDATLAALIGTRVYDGIAPQSATYPLVVLQHQAGVDAYTFAGRAFEDHVWLVRAVDKAGSADTADDIAARIDDVLTDGALAITGRRQLYLKRETTVRYPEVDGDITYRHSGATFRLVSEEI